MPALPPPQVVALVLKRLPLLEAVRTARVSRSFARAARSLSGLRLAATVTLSAGRVSEQFAASSSSSPAPGCQQSLMRAASLCECLQSPYAAQITRLDLTVQWSEEPQPEQELDFNGWDALQDPDSVGAQHDTDIAAVLAVERPFP